MSFSRITKAVVCEDVRVEQNGKFILIGVYTDNSIGIPQTPIRVQFSCYAELKSSKSGELSGDYRIIDTRSREQEKGKFRIISYPDFVFSVHFLHLAFIAQEAGVFKLQWTLDGQEWDDVTTVKFVQSKPATLPLGPAPPS